VSDVYTKLRERLLKAVQALFESRALTQKQKRQALQSIVTHIQALIQSLDD